MRISNALWISSFLMIGVAINLQTFPAQAFAQLNDSFIRATQLENSNDSIAPYRGSGR
jgi:hypothetical protein